MGLTFQLKAAHLVALSRCERNAYRGLIGTLGPDAGPRQKFVARAETYHPHDERLLPYPERSSRGIMLLSLAQRLAGSDSALVLEALNPQMRPFISKKLQHANYTENEGQKLSVYSVKGQEFWAALMSRGGNPFDAFRERAQHGSVGLPSLPRRLLCVIDPPGAVCQNTDEWRVAGMFIRLASSHTDDRLKQAAHVGLTKVTPLDHGVWVVPSD